MLPKTGGYRIRPYGFVRSRVCGGYFRDAEDVVPYGLGVLPRTEEKGCSCCRKNNPINPLYHRILEL